MTRRKHLVHGLMGLATATAVAALPIPHFGLRERLLCAFDAGALVYLAVVWRHLIRAGPAVSAAVGDEDQGHLVITLAALFAATAGLVGVAMIGAHLRSPLPAVLGLVTIILSWLLLQTVFAAHYANQYRRDRGEEGPANGLDFPGDGPIGFLDFVYVAFTVGLTFQVSDVTTNTAGMRRIVTAHAVVAFLFNTVVIAIAVGVAAGWFASS